MTPSSRALPVSAALSPNPGMQMSGIGSRVWLAAACLLLLAVAPAFAAQDDLVPGGIFNFSVATSHETQFKAVARDGANHDLTVYALPSTTNAGQVSGSLSREYNETDLIIQYGLTDTWNLALVLPYVQAIQHSSLQVIDANASPNLVATVANLQDKTISGLGNYRLVSIHRPIFKDANALAFGWGLTGSTERNGGVYTGVQSFQIRDPYGSLLAFIHYTHYPTLARSRFDLRTEYQLPQQDHVTLPTGGRVSILGAPTVLSSMTWEHEPGAWGYGFRFDQKTSLQSRIDGEAQEDPIQELLFHAQIGYGNLIALEDAPIGFPYQVSLTWDTTLFAYNAPIRDRWGFQLVTYF